MNKKIFLLLTSITIFAIIFKAYKGFSTFLDDFNDFDGSTDHQDDDSDLF